MTITLFSLIAAIMSSSILMLLVFLCRKLDMLVKRFGITTFIVLYMVAISRALLPFTLSFTRVVSTDHIYPEVYSALNRTVSDDLIFTLGFVLGSIWVIVAIALIVSFLVKYENTNKKLERLAINGATEQVYRIFDKVEKESARKIEVEVICSSAFEIPMSAGLLDKKILIPKETYTDEELYGIIKHEYMHHQSGDLWIKMLTTLFMLLMWWNPIAYLVRLDISKAIELRCDEKVTKSMEKTEKGVYLSSIIRCIRHKDSNDKIYLGTGLSGTSGESFLKKRFKFIANPSKATKRERQIFSVLVAGISALVFILSFALVFQPQFMPSSDDLSIIEEISPRNSEIVKDNKSNEYMFYHNNNSKTYITKDRAKFMEKNGFNISEYDVADSAKNEAATLEDNPGSYEIKVDLW